MYENVPKGTSSLATIRPDQDRTIPSERHAGREHRSRHPIDTPPPILMGRIDKGGTEIEDDEDRGEKEGHASRSWIAGL